MEISEHYLPSKAFLRCAEQFGHSPCDFLLFLPIQNFLKTFLMLICFTKRRRSCLQSFWILLTTYIYTHIYHRMKLETDKSTRPTFLTFHCPSFHSHRESFTLSCLFCGNYWVPLKFIYCFPEIPYSPPTVQWKGNLSLSIMLG